MISNLLVSNLVSNFVSNLVSLFVISLFFIRLLVVSLLGVISLDYFIPLAFVYCQCLSLTSLSTLAIGWARANSSCSSTISLSGSK